MLARCVSLEGLMDYLRSVRPARRIDRVIVHHFWQPDARHWRGLKTLIGVHDFHVKQRGWRDIGYHLIVGPDASIWLGRPLEQSGAHTAGQNSRSVGMAYAANFGSAREDRDAGLTPDDPAECGYETGVAVAAALCTRFGLDEECVFFHRDFARKTCPGDRMDRRAFREAVTARMEGSQGDYVRLKIDDKLVIGAQVRIRQAGTAYGLEGPIARALGAEPEAEQELVPVRAYLAERGVVIPSRGWHPEQGPAGTIYAYSTRDAPEEGREVQEVEETTIAV